MYSSKNSQFTSIYFANRIINLRNFVLCMLIMLLFSGCSKKDVAPSVAEDTTPSVTDIISTTPIPSLNPTPTLKPSASVSLDEQLTTQSAQAILEDRIDTEKYKISLLSENLLIDSTYYIAFIANENSDPIEPILLVNKSNGSVSCLSSQGKCISFSNFPTLQQQEETNLDWNGTFYYQNENGTVIGTLQILQNDSSSFEFYLYRTDNIASSILAGIGHIDGKTAIFTDEAENELIFSLVDQTITVYDSDETFTTSGLSINGDYVFQSSDFTEDHTISMKHAIELLNQLTMYQTKLPANLSEYTLKSQASSIIVKDRICHVINAYAKLEKEQVLMTTFYVSVDGAVIFAYDNISNEPYAVISLN